MDIALPLNQPNTLNISPTSPYETKNVKNLTIIPPAIDVSGREYCNVKSKAKNLITSEKMPLQRSIKTTIEDRMPISFFILIFDFFIKLEHPLYPSLNCRGPSILSGFG